MVYQKGKQIKSLHEFVCRLEERFPFYWRRKFLAAGFIEHWSFAQITKEIRYGNLHAAERPKGEKK